MNKDAVQHERGPRKPKPGSLMGLHSNVKHPTQSCECDSDVQTQKHSSKRLAQNRFVPFPRIARNKPRDSTSPSVSSTIAHPPASSTIYHSTAISVAPHLPLLQVILYAEKCQERSWNARLRGDVDNSSDQVESNVGDNSDGSWTNVLPMRENFQETTARLLFMVVQWVQWLSPFQALPESDRRLLLEETWSQLFLIHLAQWSGTWNISNLLEDEEVCRRFPDASSRHELETIMKIMCRFKDLDPDSSECGYMKAATLFTPDVINLSSPETVEMLQNQTLATFHDYTTTRYIQQLKFWRLLRLLRLLCVVKPRTIELLLFHEAVGQIPIAQLLDKMYQNVDTYTK